MDETLSSLTGIKTWAWGKKCHNFTFKEQWCKPRTWRVILCFLFFLPDNTHIVNCPLLWCTKLCCSSQAKINMLISYGFKRCSAEDTTGIWLLTFHRSSGLTEADLVIPKSREIRSLNCFCSAWKDWSCPPKEALHMCTLFMNVQVR